VAAGSSSSVESFSQLQLLPPPFRFSGWLSDILSLIKANTGVVAKLKFQLDFTAGIFIALL